MTAPSPELTDWPAHWTQAAIDAAETVLDQRPDLAGAEWAALEQACALITLAERNEEVASADDYRATGSTGQVVAHPCAIEARHNRAAAATILARLTPPTGRMTPSQKGQAGAAARYGGKR